MLLMVLGLAIIGLTRFWGSPVDRVVAAPPSGGAAVVVPPATSSSQGAGVEVVVYVSGAVAAPGIQRLPEGSRVADAVDAALGPLESADLAALNLARVLVDGEQIHVSVEGQAGGGGPVAEAAGPSCVDINLATEDDLQTLTGIGPKLAQRIIEHRQANGSFSSNAALIEVPGIGEKLLGGISADLC